MIKNERQYRITRAEAERFERALAELGEGDTDENVHPLLRNAQADALRSQLADLRAELLEYDSLRTGTYPVPDPTAYADLPRVLIQRRIALGLSQRDLADRLGLKEQQIQRYEATDFAGASFARLKDVIRALEVAQATELRPGSLSLDELFRRLKELGFERGFATARLIPRQIVGQIEAAGEASESLVLQAADAAARVLQLSVDQLLGTSRPHLNSTMAVDSARFKVAQRVNEQFISAYAVYARYLASLVLEATSHITCAQVPTDWRTVRSALTSSQGSTEFESVITYIWNLGVPVLPLRDSGAFHGACWRENGRNVIVLKQRTQSASRWAFDALHELRHGGEEPELQTFGVVETDDDVKRWQQPNETVASRFAGDVLLNGRAEELAQRCAQLAGKSIPRLKMIVPEVAKQEGVPLGSLANYMAFRLALEGQNWWGTATTLQSGGPNPWEISRDLLLQRVDLGRLKQVDRDLLGQALSAEEA